MECKYGHINKIKYSKILERERERERNLWTVTFVMLLQPLLKELTEEVQKQHLVSK